jgi:hypothetical protein
MGKAARRSGKGLGKVAPEPSQRAVKLPPITVEDLMRVPPTKRRQTFSTALEALEALQEERISRDLVLEKCVQIAREQGATWAQIGLHLGMSPWGASKRFNVGG